MQELFHQQAVLSAENSPFSFLHIFRVACSHVHFLRRMWQLRVQKYSVMKHSHPQSHTHTHTHTSITSSSYRLHTRRRWCYVARHCVFLHYTEIKQYIHIFNKIIRIWGYVVNTNFKYRPGGPERPTLQDTTTRSFKQAFKFVCINCYNSSQMITHSAGWQKHMTQRTKCFTTTNEGYSKDKYTVHPAHNSCRESLIAQNARIWREFRNLSSQPSLSFEVPTSSF